jgi:hypothetical protein
LRDHLAAEPAWSAGPVGGEAEYVAVVVEVQHPGDRLQDLDRRVAVAALFEAQVYSLLIPESMATSSRRSPGTRRRFADGPYDPPGVQLQGLDLRGWGYRWIRLRRGRSV